MIDALTNLDVSTGMYVGTAALVMALIVLLLRRARLRRKAIPVVGAQLTGNAADLAALKQGNLSPGQQAMAMGEEPEGSKPDSLAAKLAQFGQGQSEGELESPKDQPEALAVFAQDESDSEIESTEEQLEGQASDEESQGQPKTEDTVLNLFTDEIVEESNISKFAAALDNVDVHDLLEEAQKLKNQLRGARG